MELMVMLLVVVLVLTEQRAAGFLPKTKKRRHDRPAPPDAFPVPRDGPLPTRAEIIAASFEPEEACRRRIPGLLMLLYTPGRAHRAVIVRRKGGVRVLYERLLLPGEDELRWYAGAEPPAGDWEWDGGESWFDDAQTAEASALAVLALLARAE